MASVAGVKANSHFATLLRRSKFASFDPKIGQVYYSYDGDAHRGNFGLKRPLPLRRRKAHIAVSAVDSKEQQTEWKHADNEARWMKMWDEVGITPENGEGAPWSSRLGARVTTLDSEFAVHKEGQNLRSAAFSATFGGQSDAVPNIDAMSPKQFDAYLARLRELRPAFQQYLNEVVPNMKKDDFTTNIWKLVKNPAQMHDRFLRHQAHKYYTSPESRVIEQQPSRSAGLVYAKTPILQSFLYAKSHKGRILESRSGGDMLGGYAGINAHIPSELRGSNNKTIDWNALAQSGEHRPDEASSKFRIVKATLRDVPNVVGAEPQGLEGLRMDTYLLDMSNSAMKFFQSTPRRPGSREYVAGRSHQQGSRQVTNIVRLPKQTSPLRPSLSSSSPSSESSGGEGLLSTLAGLASLLPPKA